MLPAREVPEADRTGEIPIRGTATVELNMIDRHGVVWIDIHVEAKGEIEHTEFDMMWAGDWDDKVDKIRSYAGYPGWGDWAVIEALEEDGLYADKDKIPNHANALGIWEAIEEVATEAHQK